MRVNSYRAGPILLVCFAVLVGLTALTGVVIMTREQEAYRESKRIEELHRRVESSLTSVGTAIYVGGLLARDYLLDPSKAEASMYRSRLAAEKSSMNRAFAELQQVLLEDDRPRLRRLQDEAQKYWDVLDPLFAWTSQEKINNSWKFLRTEVLPHRESALSVARQIASIAQANVEHQRQALEERQESLSLFIRRMLGATVIFGVIIAGLTFVSVSKLESKSHEQRRLTEAAEGELRRLSRQLVQGQEEERKVISRELHDEVGQMLTALRMEVASLQELRGGGAAEFNEHADSAKRLAEQSLRALKDIAMGLRPSMLDDLGLGSAVHWQARQFSKHTGIPVNVQLEGLPSDLPERHRTCVYRVVQEALTNAARHSRAKAINVNVSHTAGRLVVSVQDDGTGFTREGVRGRGLGLLGMQERVMELGGDLTIESQHRKGTLLTAAIPLEMEASPHGDSHIAGR